MANSLNPTIWAGNLWCPWSKMFSWPEGLKWWSIKWEMLIVGDTYDDAFGLRLMGFLSAIIALMRFLCKLQLAYQDLLVCYVRDFIDSYIIILADSTLLSSTHVLNHHSRGFCYTPVNKRSAIQQRQKQSVLTEIWPQHSTLLLCANC